ncbi:hypothetical protein [Streptomyces sp. CC210A]|uniref:hypothetical protein n=1 Tax=Streptomyces sp. CC210A TaxID=2898184 RepID=UPI001F3C2D18|nr:hypothetical protein [Streptomyces sp. CC210A]
MTAARPLLRTVVAGLALAGVAFGSAPAAYAQVPGENGDIKVHRNTTSATDQRNEPRVGCLFYLAAFNFDILQQVEWRIDHQPMRAGDPVLSDTMTLTSGTGVTDELTLPDGMYKVTWTIPGTPLPPAKHKVFRVDCDRNGNGGGNGNSGENGGKDHGKDYEKGHGKDDHYKHPHGGVGAGGGGMAGTDGGDSSMAFGVGSALAAGLAGTAGLVLVRRRRRAHGTA